MTSRVQAIGLRIAPFIGRRQLCTQGLQTIDVEGTAKGQQTAARHCHRNSECSQGPVTAVAQS